MSSAMVWEMRRPRLILLLTHAPNLRIVLRRPAGCGVKAARSMGGLEAAATGTAGRRSQTRTSRWTLRCQGSRCSSSVAAAVVCPRFRPLFGCVLAKVSTWRFVPEKARENISPREAPFLAFAARFGGEWSLFERLSVHAYAEGIVPAGATTMRRRPSGFSTSDRVLWTPPPVVLPAPCPFDVPACVSPFVFFQAISSLVFCPRPAARIRSAPAPACQRRRRRDTARDSLPMRGTGMLAIGGDD